MKFFSLFEIFFNVILASETIKKPKLETRKANLLGFFIC